MGPVRGPRKKAVDALVEKHLKAARKIVARMVFKMPAVLHIRDELESVALEALFKAAKDYDPERKVAFFVFAEYRIRGSIIDYIRATDPIGRHSRDKIKRGLPVSPLISGRKIISGEEAEKIIATMSGLSTPEQLAAIMQVRDHLVVAIGRLPERSKLVVDLVWRQGLNLREVGEVVGVTESRVCQIWWDSMRRLSETLPELRGDINDLS